jgi:hypothetical protein
MVTVECTTRVSVQTSSTTRSIRYMQQNSLHNNYCTVQVLETNTYMIVMIGFVLGRIPHDSTRIVLERPRVDRRLHGTTEENLGLHGKHIVLVGTVFGDGRVGKLCYSLTVPCTR